MSGPEQASAIVMADLARRLDRVSAVRYIKLGEGGGWAQEAFDGQTLLFQYQEVPHELCAEGRWDEVRTLLLQKGQKPSPAGDAIRELKAFYTLDEHCLWFTFANGHLWWSFASPEIEVATTLIEGRPVRWRRTIGGWFCQSLTGEPLLKRSLSSALTKVTGYQKSICETDHDAYLLARIRGEDPALVSAARKAKADLENLCAQMIAALDWRDFETLVDLIFARGGWQRQTALGKGQIDHDLILTHPITRETAWVQIKSKASQAVLDDYWQRFSRDGSCDRFFFVCHSPLGLLTLPDEPGAHLWSGRDLGRLALDAGLLDWLIDRGR